MQSCAEQHKYDHDIHRYYEQQNVAGRLKLVSEQACRTKYEQEAEPWSEDQSNDGQKDKGDKQISHRLHAVWTTSMMRGKAQSKG